MASILDALLERLGGLNRDMGASERRFVSGAPPPISPETANPQLPQIPPEIQASVLNALTQGISPEAQQRVNTTDSISGQFGAGLSALGESVASRAIPDFSAAGTPQGAINAISNIPQGQDFFKGLGLDPQVQTAEQDQLPVEEVPVSPPQPEEGGFNIGKILPFLIPALTAGVGMGVPGALPGAAGFQAGFTKETQRQQAGKEKQGEQESEFQRQVSLEVLKQKLKSLDKEDLKSSDVKNIAKVLKENKGMFGSKSKATKGLIDTLLNDKGLVLDGDEIRVRFLDPEGKAVTLPADQIQAAEDAGFQRR